LLTKSNRGWHLVAPTWLKMAALGAASAAGVFLYASQIEPRWVQIRCITLPLWGLPSAFDGYRLIQISDLHLAEGKPYNAASIRRLVGRLNRLKPDLIVITGDFVSHLDDSARVGIAELAGLKARDGVLGISGNHDYWNGIYDVTGAVEAARVDMLFNEHRLLQRKGQTVTIAGLDDVWEGHPDLSVALAGTPADSPVILLAHEPNYAEIAASEPRVVLMLSGHSHGGQVRIPGLGPLALPDLSFRHPMGLDHVDAAGRDKSMWVYTNRGVGIAEIPYRLFCRPEITVFTLRADTSSP
jgi:predicted MPP superfamily phosphohydrolase